MMKKYEAYKDSGVEWLGMIPEVWKVCKLGYQFKFQTGATPSTKNIEFFEGENKWANISDLKSKCIYDTNKHLSNEGADLCSMNISPKGSLMFSFKLSVGAVAFCGEDMYTNEAIATFLKGRNSLDFLYYMAPICIIQNASFNIYGAPILNQELINSAKVIIPPLAEQQAIASYLDHKVGEIDASVSAINTQIEDLKAYRQSVISEAVTKGLNPDAKMKDSGVEWIGEIPEGWKVCKLGYQFKFQTGATPSTKNIEFFEGENKWANISDLKSKCIYDTNKHLSNEGAALCSMNISPKGSLMFSFKLSVGAVAFCGEDMYTNEAIATFLKGRNSLDFLYYMAPICIIQNASFNIYGAPILNQELINSAKVIIPPLAEQQAIADYLDKKTSKIDTAIATLEAQRADLNALKQSIISEAVTGKIDVRDWKPKKC